MFPFSFTTCFNETVSRTQESVDGNQIYVSMVLNLQVLYTVIDVMKDLRGWYAQLVEHCTGIAEVTGSNPAEAWIFFRLLLSAIA